MRKHYSILTISFFSSLLFTLLVFTGCKKEPVTNPVNTNNTAPANPVGEYFLKGVLGNEVIILQNNPSYFTNVSVENLSDHDGDNSLNGGEDNDHDLDDKSLLITGCKWNLNNVANSTVTGSISVQKEVFRIYVTPFMNNSYFGMWQPGTYNFAYNGTSKNGAYITVVDSKGTLWTSKGDQTGSTFSVTSRGSAAQSSVKVSGTLNCKMYDANGNMKPFTQVNFTANAGL